MGMGNAFSEKTAIVTGAASGIGLELAAQLSAAGAYVLATDVVDTVETVAAEISHRGGHAKAMLVDVSKREDLQAAVDSVVAEHGRLDYIFNNAGVAIFGEFELVSLDEWDKVIDVNLRGVAYGAKIAWDQMVRQGSGHIVSTASVAGLLPVPLQAHYVATKHAVVGMHKTLELEAPDHGIKTTVFCPAFIETGMIENNTMHGSLSGVDARKLVPVRPLSAEKAAARLLHGVAAGKPIVITPFYGRLGWWLERFSRRLSQALHRRTLHDTRRRARRAARSPE